VKIALITLLSAFLLSNAYADNTRYISDALYVPMRSGKGNQFRIINSSLSSGTKLTLIEEDAENKWSLVETGNGVRGWIRNQYLQQGPTAKLQLVVAQNKITNLDKLRRELLQQVKTLKIENQTLSESFSSIKLQQDTTNSELKEIKQISADAVDMYQRYQAIIKEHQLLQTELDVLKTENSRLEDNSKHKWFMYGVGAVMLGIFIAILIPVLRPRRRSSDWA